MMNFVNSIPTNIGWMLVGAVAAILLYFLLDIIKMAFIGIKDRREEPEPLTSSNCVCLLCGRAEEPHAEKVIEEGIICKLYECNECGTQWSVEEVL